MHQVIGGDEVSTLAIAIGSNFGTILALGDQLITGVDFAASQDLSYADISQTRISGAANGILPPRGIPEPNTVALFGIGLIGAGVLRKRRVS